MFQHFLILLVTVFSFAAGAGEQPSNLDASPKKLILQSSISEKVKIKLPKVDLHKFHWSCFSHERNTKGFPFICSAEEALELGNVVIGNSIYKTKVKLNGAVETSDPSKLMLELAWKDLPQYAKLEYLLEEYSSGANYTLSIERDYAFYKRTGVRAKDGKLNDRGVINFPKALIVESSY